VTGTSEKNPEKIFRNLSYFSVPAKAPVPDHVCHALHHNFTTKNTTFTIGIFQNTLKKRRKSTKKVPEISGTFFR
jgi:hypothetical protein